MRLIVLSAAFLFSGPTFAADSYLCVTDSSTGFSFNNVTRQWTPTRFSANGKYVVSKAKQGGWVVKEMGQEFPAVSTCAADFNQGGTLFCNDGFTDFRLNRNRLRFLKAYLVGYYVDYSSMPKPPAGVNMPAMTEGGDTPELEIGKCTPM